MDEIDYTPAEYKAAAYAIAEAAPRHLDQPTTPPIHWRLEGDLLRVLLADGRTVRGPLPAKKVKKSPAAPPIMALPVHEIHAPDKVRPAGKEGKGKK